MISRSARFNAASEIIDEVVRIAGRNAVEVNVPEVIDRLAFLKKIKMVVSSPSDCCICTTGNEHGSIFSFLSWIYPISIRVRHWLSCQPPKTIEFFPMWPEDASFDAIAEFHVAATELASFGARSNGVYMNMSSGETLRTLACAFIHELGHAKAAHEQGRIWHKAGIQSEDQRLLEELEMWTVDARLMYALGGYKYQCRANHLMNAMLDSWSKNMSLRIPPGIGSALDDCLGFPNNGKARLNRDMSFQAYCALMASDFLTGEIRIKQKLFLIGQIYKPSYQRQAALIQNFQSRYPLL